jgi:hypothetical protein
MNDIEVNKRSQSIKINSLVVDGETKACNFEKISPRQAGQE